MTPESSSIPPQQDMNQDLFPTYRQEPCSWCGGTRVYVKKLKRAPWKEQRPCPGCAHLPSGEAEPYTLEERVERLESYLQELHDKAAK